VRKNINQSYLSFLKKYLSTMKTIKLEIPNDEYREQMIKALGCSGYPAWVEEEEKTRNTGIIKEKYTVYYVNFEM